MKEVIYLYLTLNVVLRQLHVNNWYSKSMHSAPAALYPTVASLAVCKSGAPCGSRTAWYMIFDCPFPSQTATVPTLQFMQSFIIVPPWHFHSVHMKLLALIYRWLYVSSSA